MELSVTPTLGLADQFVTVVHRQPEFGPIRGYCRAANGLGCVIEIDPESATETWTAGQYFLPWQNVLAVRLEERRSSSC